MIHDLPAARPPLVGQINCRYCSRRHSRRYACDDLLEAALQHDVRTGRLGDADGARGMAAGVLRRPRRRGVAVSDSNSPMLDAAITMHEMFVTLMRAGFNERQALVIVSELVRSRSEDDDR